MVPPHCYVVVVVVIFICMNMTFCLSLLLLTEKFGIYTGEWDSIIRIWSFLYLAKKYVSTVEHDQNFPSTLLDIEYTPNKWLLLFVLNCLYFLQSNKAFKRIDIDKKKEEIDKVKMKYGINAEEKKWNYGESFCFW